MKTSRRRKSTGAITRGANRAPSVDFEDHLLADLKDAAYAAGYLSAALEEGEDVFLLAVRDVVQAHGGMSQIASLTRLNRENLYDMLSVRGNPRLSSIAAILDRLGITMTFKPKTRAA